MLLTFTFLYSFRQSVKSAEKREINFQILLKNVYQEEDQP